MDVNSTLIEKVKQCAYNVHLAFTPGYLESVYHNALLIELRDAGLRAESEVPIKAYYKGHVVGEFKVDILVEDCLILELKAVGSLTVNHECQLVNYLKVTGIAKGALINFGSDKFEMKVKYKNFTPQF